MLSFRNVTKYYRIPGGLRYVLKSLTIDLPRDKNIAIIGRNGAGKSTLLRMISGNLRPNEGVIHRDGRVSWPIGFAGGFHPALTGRQNARFVARVYGTDTDEMVEFVEEFAELGAFLDMPFQTYSSGMRARLAFGVSMATNFDCYLVDEVTAVGDKNFRDKCKQMFQERLSGSQILMVSHANATLREYCDAALLLDAGDVWYFDDLDRGLEAYAEHLKVN